MDLAPDVYQKRDRPAWRVWLTLLQTAEPDLTWALIWPKSGVSKRLGDHGLAWRAIRRVGCTAQLWTSGRGIRGRLAAKSVDVSPHYLWTPGRSIGVASMTRFMTRNGVDHVA